MSIESGLIGAALTLAAGVALQPPLPKSAWPGGGEAVAALESTIQRSTITVNSRIPGDRSAGHRHHDSGRGSNLE